MTNKLDEIIAKKREEVPAAKQARSLQSLEEEISKNSSPRPFLEALLAKNNLGQFGLIAEIKKASPSGGLIRKNFSPKLLATAYEQGGATCLSVLTDETFFQGHQNFIREARSSCKLPILRKDFMIDTYQVTEARAMGADAILIIMACTSNELAADLASAAHSYKMAALVEVHNREELDRALELDCQLIGINNRNLKSLETRLETSEELADYVPTGKLIVGESGISTHQDLQRLSRSKINTFLVGESLMRVDDVEAATKALLYGETSDT